LRSFLTVLITFFGVAVAAAEDRVALVIGNSAYERVSTLRNAANDARDVAAKLRTLGFDVHLGLNLSGTEMRSILVTFGRAAAAADSALFFYAGHGIQSGGENYLVPIEADIAYEHEIGLTLIPMALVAGQLSRAHGTRLIFLDACRDNPFRNQLMQGMGTRGAAPLVAGLGQPRSMPGTFVAYATQPDSVATDGASGNSPFTDALLRHIDRPGQTLPDLMMAIGSDVRGATASSQDPWWSSSLRERFMFVPATEQAADEAERLLPDSRGEELASVEKPQPQRGVSAGSQPEPSPRGLLGVWRGTGRQRSGSSWSIELNLGTTGAEIAYPSLNCGGYWEKIGESPSGKVHFAETITYGRSRCVSNGYVTVNLSGTTLEYQWAKARGDRVEATSKLTKAD
jgi:hypothetical protein